MPTFEKIYYDVIRNLGCNLPDYCLYHSVSHTIYVEKMAYYLGVKMKVSEHDLLLLRVAAIYHDSGFIVQQENHESISCDLMESELPKYGFTEKDISIIGGIIIATKIPQKPKTQLEMILADADLEYLSTESFTVVSELLYQEQKHSEPNLSKKEWNKRQIDFLENHQYHTDFYKKNKENFKQQHLRKLKAKYALQVLF